MSTEVSIPRYIDSQGQFFQWEFDEFLVGTSIFILGIIMKSVILSMITAYLCVRMIRRWKEGEMDGALAHIAYWLGALGLNAVYQDGMERDYWV